MLSHVVPIVYGDGHNILRIPTVAGAADDDLAAAQAQNTWCPIRCLSAVSQFEFRLP
jgi:hypothetical protein